MHKHCFIVLTLALCTAITVPASAGWIDYSKANLPVCTAPGDQTSLTSISDGAGGAIIAWTDVRNVTAGIYVQHVLEAGAVDPAWPINGRAACTAPTGDRLAQTITSDGAGGVILAWYDSRSGTNNDIYAQRISAGGAVQWSADGVPLCALPSNQGAPTIVSDGAGGAIVTWIDYRNGTNYDIYAQRISAAGTALWATNGVALCTAIGEQVSPRTVSDGAGGAIVTWADGRSGAYDIYAQRVSADGTVQWTGDGVALCTAPNSQDAPASVSDGAGGAIVTWFDSRNGAYDIYVQRVSAAGTVQWAANGVALCTTRGEQHTPTIVTDGAGGAIVTWYDSRNGNGDIYAQRVSAGGAVQWTGDGVAICALASHQGVPAIVSDDAGGAIVIWYDLRDGTGDIYAQRISADGTAQWATNGVALCTAPDYQWFPTIVSDGAGGAIASWQDYRSGTNYDIYAQRVTTSGHAGDISVAPAIAGARDIPNDQGGKLKLMWNASLVDAHPYDAIADYRVWRSVPPAFAQSALTSGARLVRPGEQLALEPGRSFRMSSTAAGIVYWEYYGTEVARRFAGYSMVVNTVCDSVADSNPYTLFMVEARHVNGVEYFDSAPDSGYSVDNLSPAQPQPFVATYAPSGVALHWGPNREADLHGYRVYRGTRVDFVPGPENLVVAKPDTGFVDHPGTCSVYYKLSAVDTHGNESRFALVTPAGPTATLASLVSAICEDGVISLLWSAAANPGLVATLYRQAPGDGWRSLGSVMADGTGLIRYEDAAVDPGERYGYRLGVFDGDQEVLVGETWVDVPVLELALRGVRPNPVVDGVLRVQLTLPTAEPASLDLFDVRGRRVANLEAGSLGAGMHVVEIRPASPLPAGVYLVRLTQANRSLTTKAAVVR